MGLFTIADLHLSGFKDKPMDIFGDNWIGHREKIEDNWKKTVASNDTVLIPGDISWALNIKEAECDLKFLENLPGKKILLRGNHDYWWGKLSKLNSTYSGMCFLQNTFTDYEGIAICAARGWTIPQDESFSVNDDEKLYKREIIRSKLSLDAAMLKGYEEIIFMTHFPPAYDWARNTEFTELFKQYPIKKVVYGHLHGEKNFSAGIKGIVDGIEYIMASSDYLDFCPRKIMN